MNPSERIIKARLNLEVALQLLREERDIRKNAGETGGRELSEAITSIETGSMFMNGSLFSHEPYTPVPEHRTTPKKQEEPVQVLGGDLGSNGNQPA